MTDKSIRHEKLNGGYLRYDHLLGKSFEHGKQDCYTILADLFKDNLNVTLTAYARPDDWWIDDDMDLDLYRQNYEREGFQLVDMQHVRDLRILDVALISIPDPRNPKRTVINHCAIYVGEGMVVHHPYGRFSEKSRYAGGLKNFTSMIIRHRDVPDLEVRKEQKLDLMSMMLPHKRAVLEEQLNERK